MFENLTYDLRLAVRRVVQGHRLYAAIVIVLGLGIGANVGVLSVANATLFRPVGISQPESLYWVKTRFANGASIPLVPYANLMDLKEASDFFTDLVVRQDTLAELGQGSTSERLLGGVVSSNYFSVLGVRIALGRGFVREDDLASAPPVVVLSREVWTRRFGADRSIIDRIVHLNGKQFSVIGVCAEEFTGVAFGPQPQFWVPLSHLQEFVSHSNALLSSRDALFFNGIVRLPPQFDIMQAQARAGAIGTRLALEHPENKGRSFLLTPMNETGAWLRPAAALVSSAGALVLLVACANVANLWLVMLGGRRKELAVRIAVGATRLRVARELLLEVLLICSLCRSRRCSARDVVYSLLGPGIASLVSAQLRPCSGLARLRGRVSAGSAGRVSRGNVSGTSDIDARPCSHPEGHRPTNARYPIPRSGDLAGGRVLLVLSCCRSSR